MLQLNTVEPCWTHIQGYQTSGIIIHSSVKCFFYTTCRFHLPLHQSTQSNHTGDVFFSWSQVGYWRQALPMLTRMMQASDDLLLEFWRSIGDETITQRDVSGCKFGTFFKFKFWGTEKRGGKWAIKIPWFQRMEVNQWIQWAFYMISRNYKRHMVSVTSKSTQRISTATVHLWFRKLWCLTASVAALQCQPASNKASGNSSWPFLGWISDPFKG